MKPNSVRQAEYHARARAKGMVRLQVMLSPGAAVAFDALVKLHGSKRAAVEAAFGQKKTDSRPV